MRQQDIYYDGIMKLIFGVYSQNKEVIRDLINQGSSVIMICVIAYNLLTYDKVIDPIDSTDRKEISHYLINII